jgi:serine phosphatase RsbU (regulator of sigma subunit)/TPR repeat protein
LTQVTEPSLIKFYKEVLVSSYEKRGFDYKKANNFKDAALDYEKSISILKSLNDSTLLPMSHLYLGTIYKEKGNYLKAISNFKESAILYKKNENFTMVNFPLSDLAGIYIELKDTLNSLYYRKEILKYSTLNKDTFALAYGNRVLGEIYSKSDFKKSIHYYKKSIQYSKAINQNGFTAMAQTGIAFTYSYKNDYENAFLWMDKVLHTCIINNISLSNYNYSYGLLLCNKGDYSKAIEYFQKSLSTMKTETNINKVIPIYNKLTDAYLNENNLTEAENYATKALLLSKKSKSIVHIKNSSELLYQVYKIQNNPKEALPIFELFIQMKDSLKSEELNKASIKTRIENEYTQKKIKDELKINEERKFNQLKFEKERTIRFFMYGGIVLLILFFGYTFYRLRLSKKQNKIIEKQKGIVEEAHGEIKDSMEYAKRIQNAIFPASKIVKEYLKESFVLYKPKDIVAGDFYWMEQKGNKVLFAAADCTGHGVPGAMVSVLCNGALNRSVREFDLSDPADILEKAREIVIQEFEKSEEDVKDGMDIALCSLEGMKLKYAGAHNPLWILHNGEVIETKAHKQPIGKFDKLTSYTTHTFNLETGDTIYIFSDGYIDQFGGEKGKKFKAKAFRTLLLSIQDKSMEEQKEIIDDTFETWRGDLEQIDDVCIIGVRV